MMWMQRQGAGVECMQRWREILLSGKFSTDQQSLDEAEALGEILPSDGTPYTLKAVLTTLISRILLQRPELSYEAPAIRQGLHRHGADVGTDFHPCDCGGAAGRHRLLLPCKNTAT